MEILDDSFILRTRGQYGKYTELYDKLTALPIGTTVQLTAGDDFTGDPKKFISAVRTGLWNRGWRTNARIIDGDVYLRIPGPKNTTPRTHRTTTNTHNTPAGQDGAA